MAEKPLRTPSAFDIPYVGVHKDEVTSKLNDKLLGIFRDLNIVIEEGGEGEDPRDFIVHQHVTEDHLNMYTFDIFLRHLSNHIRGRRKVSFYSIDGPYPDTDEICNCQTRGPHLIWKITIQFRT